MDKPEISTEPYDGTAPADAELATSSDDGAAAEVPKPDGDKSSDGDELTGTTAQQQPRPGALVEGNRIAVAEDME